MQLGATVAITRAFGYRATPTALLAGAAMDAGTHAAIDRGAVLLWPAKKTGETAYIEHCRAARVDDDGKATSELTGPGSAWMELDAALHRSIGIAAAAVTTWLTTRQQGDIRDGEREVNEPAPRRVHAVSVPRVRQP
ncbi:hypothetical protein AB0469_39150 [Streptomyces sp. NPDC093801]|uniref:hypothetical protein n=1 Tax=Streptomyces sp. NPDC093801 TaxID=3155203 RepID=UPI00344CD9AE